MNLQRVKNYASFFGRPFDAENLFGDLSPQASESFNHIRQTKEVAPGEKLCAEGATPCCVYILRRGEAQWLVKDETGRPQSLRPVEPNEIIGLTETIGDLPFAGEVEAVTACQVDCIRQADFLALLASDPRLCFQIVRMLGSNLHRSLIPPRSSGR
jgi:CRP-like cAMP-binding protein